MPETSASRAVLAGALDVLDVAAFTALTRIGNGTPTGTAFPYSTLTASERRFDTFGKRGKEVDLRLHVWTDHQGDERALKVIEKAVELLDDEAGQAVKIAATGYTVLQVLYEGHELMTEQLIGAVQARQHVALFTVRVLAS